MKELELTSRFKKDLKRIQNNPQRILNVKRVLEFLQDEVPLPSKYRMHKLTGNYNGCWEAMSRMTSFSFGLTKKRTSSNFFVSAPTPNSSELL